MRQIWTTRTGPPEVLQVREAPDPQPGKGEVRIRVHASGVNFADVMARLGLYPDAPKLPAVFGYEVSGVVDALGAGVKAFKEGDKVIGLCRFGGFSDVVALPEIQVTPLPARLTFAQGAAIPVNYLTAYQMLFVMGSIKRGERVLVHSAGGGVGFAAIDLCAIAGAEVIGTASEKKHAALHKRGVKHVIDYTKHDFEEEVKKITHGKGVHIILDPVGGESWAKGLRSLAPTGRLVVFGFSAAATGKKPNPLSALRNALKVPWLKFNPVALMNGNKAVIGVNVGHLWGEAEMVQGWMRQLVAWAEEGRIHPTVDHEFKFDDAPKAHHHIQDRKNLGKVVLVP
jgi:NADPH:quinone reductase-like Zn-dependent oxidoreductase